MSKAIQLTIKEPCHENWQNMTPNEQGRHCMSCRKTVVDFTNMSDKEVLAFFTKATSNVCGRFNNHQLDRDIKEQQVKKRRFTFAYAWSVMTATFLITASAKAQGQVRLKGKVKVEEKVIPAQHKPVVMGMILPEIVLDHPLNGMVLDQQTMEPVIGASVKFRRSETGKPTNDKGAFLFDRHVFMRGEELEISAVGYETQILPLNAGINKDLIIYLKPKAEELDPVEVIGYGPTVGKVDIVGGSMPLKVDTSAKPDFGGPIDTSVIVLGGISMCNKPTVTEKVKSVISDWIPAPFKNNKVKIFPNPQRPGNTLNISLQLKETGEYKMELMDASGRVMWVQPIQVTAKEQNVTLPTNSAWSTGIYYVRITGHKDKNVYQSKVLLQ